MTMADATMGDARHRQDREGLVRHIVDGAGRRRTSNHQIIRAELDRVDSDPTARRPRRLAKLSGGVAVLKVGATESS